jgi:hypothetical protein
MSEPRTISLPAEVLSTETPTSYGRPFESYRSRDKDARSERTISIYGRHSNQWLFNDFKLRKTVSNFFRKLRGKKRRDSD